MDQGKITGKVVFDLDAFERRLERQRVIEFSDVEVLIEVARDYHHRVGRLQAALIECVWAFENAGIRPIPAYDDARRVLGPHDPLRHIRGPIDEEADDSRDFVAEQHVRLEQRPDEDASEEH